MNPPDRAPVQELIEAFRRSKVMFTAVSMGVFSRLHMGAKSAAGLAAEMAVNQDALERLLDTCAALGLVRKSDGIYTNEPITEAYLVDSSPDSMCGYIRYSDEALFPMWGHLGDAIREGTHRWNQSFGVEGGIFSGFFRTDEARRTFLHGMHGLGLPASRKIVAAFDLGRYRRMVDLGGATGHLVIAACERCPDLTGAVFDLPGTVALARPYVEQSAAASRVELLAGDFFADPLPPADLYALGRILHDWTEAKIHLLLGKIFDALPAGGGLLIAEKLLNEDGVGPIAANLQSLNMLVVTEGKERSLGGYTRLLRDAGFGKVSGVRTGAYLDAVLAEKESA